MLTSRKLADCAPSLQLRYADLEAMWNDRYRFRRLIITCTHRDAEAQHALWEQGRVTKGPIVTFCNGTTTLSPHNRYPAEAVDVAIRLLPGDPDESVVKEVVTWKAPLYWPLLELARLAGLVSGGTFRMKDWPHLELPAFPSPSNRIQTT